MMNKPAGYLTTVKDTHDRPTVMDLLTGIPYRVFPVGRLDFETEGLLLLTNDGEFAYRMTHPKFKIKKTYLATVQGELTKERLNLLRNGVELEDGKTAPAEVNIVRQEKHRTVVEITIHEGKNRQVRRMFKAVKNPVLELKRINVGGLTLKGVGSGEIRSLTDEEVQKLTQRLGMHRSGKA
jgi:pseudouridine synthase